MVIYGIKRLSKKIKPTNGLTGGETKEGEIFDLVDLITALTILIHLNILLYPIFLPSQDPHNTTVIDAKNAAVVGIHQMTISRTQKSPLPHTSMGLEPILEPKYLVTIITDHNTPPRSHSTPHSNMTRQGDFLDQMRAHALKQQGSTKSYKLHKTHPIKTH